MASKQPWHTDRDLDERIVRAILDEQIPELRGASVEHIGSGWDNDAYRVAGAWILRFPRRAEVVDQQARELANLPHIARQLDVQVPVPQITGAPSELFPYPFMAYRALEGVCGDDIEFDPSTLECFGEDVARLLSQLRALDVDALELSQTDETPSTLRSQLAERQDELASLLGEARAEAWSRRYLEAAPPAYDGPPCYVHGDFASKHMLFDPRTKRLTGLIDFADQHIGDPAYDLIEMFTWHGPDFARSLSPALDDQGWARLGFYVHALATKWTLDAARAPGDNDVGTWVTWLTETIAGHLEIDLSGFRP